MKQLTCEMCGGNNLLKLDGIYVCQSCGTKYTADEARKLMVEGSVKIDNSEKLSNWYILARQARESNDAENAVKYYGLIKQENPNDWEAYFYDVYYRAAQTRILFIESAANSISNCLGTVFSLIMNNSDSYAEKKAHIWNLTAYITRICSSFESSSKTTLINSWCDTSNISVQYAADYATRVLASADIYFICGDLIESNYNTDNGMMQIACELWKSGIDMWKPAYAVYDNHTYRHSSMKNSYVSKVQKYQSGYLFTAPQYVGFPSQYATVVGKNSNADFGVGYSGISGGGCYVATAVYGSYDCPQVWTLRRYRDYTLAGTWYGRAFIHAYYAASPTLVKWFGDTDWFKKLWKGKLDRMVADLKASGVEDTPYEDSVW